MPRDNNGRTYADISPNANYQASASSVDSPREPTLPSASVPVRLDDDFSYMPTFTPRHFPPPALAGVPHDYIVHKLHQLASGYWNKTETADCTIIVPIPHPVGRARRDPDMPIFAPGVSCPSSPKPDVVLLGRRVTEPILSAVPRVTFKLHVDYLSAQSSFLRGLFAGANPLDLINSSDSPPSSPDEDVTFATRRRTLPFDVPHNRLPRLLPSPPSHPTLFLPVPDPTSFHLLVHWMYFGHTDYIEDCLEQGLVHLAGIRRNVEYLGLPDHIIGKFLRRWEHSWNQSQFPHSPPFLSESESSDDEDDFSIPSDSDVDMELDDVPRRGRSTSRRS